MAKRPRISNPAKLLRQLMRQDFCAFAEKAWETISGGQSMDWNWHIDAIAHRLNQVAGGNCRRLLVTMPPRNGKTKLISIIWVAWQLGLDPTKNFVCVSYSNELSSGFARQCLAIMESAWYRELFPGTVISAKRSAAHDFETTRGGGRLATSVSGTLTGRGGDIIILDDVIKPDEAASETTRENVNTWYRSTLTSRLNDKRSGAIICVMQRLHQFDLAGLMIESGQWQHLKLAAIASEDEIVPLTRGQFHHRRAGEVLHPSRESREVLDEQRQTMGSELFNAQYQQDPVPAGGLVFKSDWLGTYDPALLERWGGRIIQSWDTANKTGETNAWSACVTALVIGKSIYLLNVFRARLEAPELLKQAIALGLQYRPHALLIEDKASGEGLIPFLRAERDPVLHPIPRAPNADKLSRARGVSPMVEQGRLFLPQEAQWLGEFKSELLGFPNVRYCDQVDALVQLLDWLRNEDIRPITSTAGPEDVFDCNGNSVDSGHEYDETRDPWDA
jgi:predicted phage terminase large subunit-like protein